MINNPIANDFLSQSIGEDDLKNVKAIIQALINGSETDEEIHEKTEIKLNTVRKLLYKLHDASIANYKRNYVIPGKIVQNDITISSKREPELCPFRINSLK